MTTASRGGRWAVCWTARGAPYVRYASSGAGRIHLITTEQHPHDVVTGIYHGVIDQGRLLRSDGTVVDSNLYDASAVDPRLLTNVFESHSGAERAWTIDVQIDSQGLPWAVFSVHSERGTTTGMPGSTDRHGARD